MANYLVQHLVRTSNTATGTAGDVLGESSPVGLSWEWPLNEPQTVQYRLHLDDPLANRAKTKPDRHTFELYRGNPLFMAGHIRGVSISSEQKEQLQISCKGWLDYLDRRRYPFNPANPDQYLRDPADPPVIWWRGVDIFTIVEEMLTTPLALDNSLDLDLSFIGLAGATQYFQFPVPDMTSLFKHITDLAEQAPGFDFDITPDKVVLLWAPRRGNDTAPFYHAHLGGNVHAWSYADLGIKATRFIGFGAGLGGNRYPVLRQNLSAEAQYLNFSGTEDFGSTRDQDRLAGKTQRALNKAAQHDIELSLTFKGEHADDVMNAVELGDVIYVSGNTGYETLDRNMRVIQMRGEWTESADETIYLDVTEDYD